MGLCTAADGHTNHFHQFQRGTSDRIRNRRVNECTSKEVELDDIAPEPLAGPGQPDPRWMGGGVRRRFKGGHADCTRDKRSTRRQGMQGPEDRQRKGRGLA